MSAVHAIQQSEAAPTAVAEIDPAILDEINEAIVEWETSGNPAKRAMAARLREDRGLVGYVAGIANTRGHSFDDELRTIAGFFLAQQGTFQPFLFDDPTDNVAAGRVIGTGNSTSTSFQLVRNMGAFAEPMTAPNAVSAVYFNGVRQDPAGYTADADTGQLTFAAPPPAGQIVTADFTYRFRVRFADDAAEFENFMYQLWQLKQIKLQSVLR